MSNVSQRLTTLERITGDTNANDIPPMIYFEGNDSEHTPAKDEAYRRYKEQYQEDYPVLRRIATFSELEAYATQHGLLGRLTAVVFIDKPVEQD